MSTQRQPLPAALATAPNNPPAATASTIAKPHSRSLPDPQAILAQVIQAAADQHRQQADQAARAAAARALQSRNAHD